MPNSRLTLPCAAILALAACSAETRPAAEQSSDAPAGLAGTGPIPSAMSAAPDAVASDAAIVTVGADGQMQTVRPGKNGFTCMPDNPATPGPDPMCMDANAMDWAMAWIGHKPPPTDKPGMMYMLEGGTDASNTDPYAKAPTAGGDWIKTGAHLTLVGSQAALRGYPSGPTPDTRAPYVMWADTPYAHLMIPVS